MFAPRLHGCAPGRRSGKRILCDVRATIARMRAGSRRAQSGGRPPGGLPRKHTPIPARGPFRQFSNACQLSGIIEGARTGNTAAAAGQHDEKRIVSAAPHNGQRTAGPTRAAGKAATARLCAFFAGRFASFTEGRGLPLKYVCCLPAGRPVCSGIHAHSFCSFMSPGRIQPMRRSSASNASVTAAGRAKWNTRMSSRITQPERDAPIASNACN